MRLFTPEAMREADRKAVERGYPSLLLMEWAGMKAARVYLELFGKAPALVLAGKGNNGGDGLVVARHLLLEGVGVRVYAAGGQTGDALLALQALLAHGVEVRPLEEASFREGEVMVDALFGTGLKGPLTDFYAELVERVNRAGLPVLALDLPSGLPFSPHVRATWPSPPSRPLTSSRGRPAGSFTWRRSACPSPSWKGRTSPRWQVPRP